MAFVLFMSFLRQPVAVAGESERRTFGLEGTIHPFYRKPFEIALEQAKRKLLQSRCESVFKDFGDSEGRLLAEKLRISGRTAADYLTSIHFVDARGTAPCMVSYVYAWTNPGSGTVHICLDQFGYLARFSASVAANILIHEELHALGLGENPPTSRQITEAIDHDCGI